MYTNFGASSISNSVSGVSPRHLQQVYGKCPWVGEMLNDLQERGVGYKCRRAQRTG